MEKKNKTSGTHIRSAEELLPLVYEELRRLARFKMGGELREQTLQATALVHEAYLRLLASENRNWKNDRYFFAAAAEAMRRILIEQARRKHARRHGGKLQRLNIDECDLAETAPADELLALESALQEFERSEPAKAEVVKLKFFAGMTTPDVARVLCISEATAKRHWTFGRAWLLRELKRSSGE